MSVGRPKDRFLYLIDWLIDWLVFIANISSISAIFGFDYIFDVTVKLAFIYYIQNNILCFYILQKWYRELQYSIGYIPERVWFWILHWINFVSDVHVS